MGCWIVVADRGDLALVVSWAVTADAVDPFATDDSLGIHSDALDRQCLIDCFAGLFVVGHPVSGALPAWMVVHRRMPARLVSNGSAPTATLGVSVMHLRDGVRIDGLDHGATMADPVGRECLPV
jgi:hypothetical protein